MISASANRKTRIMIVNAGAKIVEEKPQMPSEPETNTGKTSTSDKRSTENNNENVVDNKLAPKVEGDSKPAYEVRQVTSDVNFFHKDYKSFRINVEVNLRKAKEDPIYSISLLKVKVSADASEYTTVTDTNYVTVRDAILNTFQPTDLVKMKVRVSARPSSPMKPPSPDASKSRVTEPTSQRRPSSPNRLPSPAKRFSSPQRRNESPIKRRDSPGRVRPRSTITETTPGNRTQATTTPARKGVIPTDGASIPVIGGPKSAAKKLFQDVTSSPMIKLTAPPLPTPNNDDVTEEMTEDASEIIELQESAADMVPSTPIKEVAEVSDKVITSPMEDLPDEGKGTWRENPTPRNSSANEEKCFVMGDLSSALAEVSDEQDAKIVNDVSGLDIVVENWDSEEISESPQDTSSLVQEAVVPITQEAQQEEIDENAIDVSISEDTVVNISMDASRDESAQPGFAAPTKSFSAKKAKATSRAPLVSSSATTTSGYKTALETSQEWERNLRGGGGGGFGKRSSKKSVKPKSNTANQRMVAAMRLDTSNLEPDGRPSVGTMTAQWEFMRSQFLAGADNKDEQLQWMMKAKTGGMEAYKFAHKKAMHAEDQYFKSIFDIDVLEAKLKLLCDYNAVVPTVLRNIANLHTGALAHEAEPTAKVESLRAELKELMDGEMQQMFSKNLETDIKRLCSLTDAIRITQKAQSILSQQIPEEIKQVTSRLQTARKNSEESLTAMEKWSEREKETSEYSQVLAAEDDAWMEENKEENMHALRVMRSFIPLEVTDMSVNDILAAYKANGSMCTLELAQEIKTNKLLHWLVTHTEDIAWSNFLTGEHRQYFVNIDSLDIIEMRALRVCLPDKFELDNDGAKAEWRARFISRLKQLSSQDKRECVKGAWDPECNKRAMVELPPLKPELQRRPVYFFRTYKQTQQRMKQYDDKEILLAKKEKWLSDAEAAYLDLKKEYDIILEETRDPAFKSIYGDKLLEAKELAKKDCKAAQDKFNTLTREVAQLKKTIASAPISKADYAAFVSELKTYLADMNWEITEEPVMIMGCFCSNPEIKKIERQAAKFLSSEEEALRRKTELEAMLANKEKEGRQSQESGRSVSPVSDVAEEIVGEGAVSAAVQAFSAAPVEATPAPVTPGRRKNSILMTANPEMINCLNNMFGGNTPTPKPVASARRASMFTPTKRVSICTTPVAADTNDINSAPVVTKSKILQRMMSKQEEEPERPKPFNPFGGPRMGGGGGMSFLDAIKARKVD